MMPGGPRMMMGPNGPVPVSMGPPMSGMGMGDAMSPMAGLGPGGPNGPDSPIGSAPGTPLGGTVPLGPPSHPSSSMDPNGPMNSFGGPSPAYTSAPSPAYSFGGPSPAHGRSSPPSQMRPPSMGPPLDNMGPPVNIGGPLGGPSPAHSFGGPSPAHGRASPPSQMRPPLENMGPPIGGPLGRDTVYPPDQPVIFNQENPSAPPIYPCGICRKEVHENDQAILCESGCNFWFHRVCTGLAEAAFHLLTQEIYAEWVCDSCFSTKDVPLVKFKS